MSKGRYAGVEFNRVNWATMREQVAGQRAVFAVDVAKEDFVGVLLDARRTALVTVKWTHPEQSWALVEQLVQLSEVAGLDVAMEPSGTYGDALRWQLAKVGLAVYRVSPKRVHDAAEIYDGVPSLHDAKAAYLIGRLHLEGVSQPWPEASSQRRALAAQLNLLQVYKVHERADLNRLEAQLSRHWPEALRMLEPGSVTLVRLIATYGAPSQVRAQREAAHALMRRTGRGALRDEKIEQLLASAEHTLGMPCVEAERRLLQALAQHLLETREKRHGLERDLQQQVRGDATLSRMAAVVGKTTSAVLVSAQGWPQDYPDAASYLKSLGLNLKERSSGKHQGQLKITKRGPGVARFYLYYAVLRWITHDPVIQRWYQRKVQRDGGLKAKACVALMRKFAKALWHVARGAPFDPCKLVNLQALEGTS
jgi:transposase